jgi:hypothetical protein
MKLHNPLTGVQISVDDEDGNLLLASGGYAKGGTPSSWKAPVAEYTTTNKPAAKPAAKSASGDADS